MISSHETIAVEGGAEEDPARAQRRQERLDDLLYQAVRYVPKRHRIGWLHALARRYAQPLTPEPTAAELAFRSWSARRRQGSEHASAYVAPQSQLDTQCHTVASDQQAHHTH